MEYMGVKHIPPLLLPLTLLLLLLSGCTEPKTPGATEKVTDTINSATPAKEETPMDEILITSDAFEEGMDIPVKYTCDGADRSPALSWEGLPPETESLVLIMDDPDAPIGTFTHWIIYNIPEDTKGLPEGVEKQSTLADGSRQGINNFQKIGYNGPCPPPGKPHRYYFNLYALDTKLTLPEGVSRAQVEEAITGHILAKGTLMGRYKR